MALSTSTPFFSTPQNSNTNYHSPIFLHKQAQSSINAFFPVFKLRPRFHPSSSRRPIFTVPATSSSREVYADPNHSSSDALRFVSGVSTTFTPKVASKIIVSYMEGYRQDWGLWFQKDTVSRGGCFTSEEDNGGQRVEYNNRRQVILSSVGFCAGYLLNTASFLAAPPAVAASSRSGFADMPALKGKDYGKTKMRYPDYTETESGLQFKDLRLGTGPTPKIGETVVVDWDGYTIGYYGRIFEARNKTKGGSFEGGDKDFFKFKIGSQEVIPAFEEAVTGMSLGGIRRIIVPPELGYPDNDYNKKGPKPTTFSGQRALDFVLRNQGLIDKTLLFDIELLKIIPN